MTVVRIPANTKQLVAKATAEVAARAAVRFQRHKTTEPGPKASKRKAIKKD